MEEVPLLVQKNLFLSHEREGGAREKEMERKQERERERERERRGEVDLSLLWKFLL